MRILFVATAWPWPVRKGHQVRTLQLATLLAREHAVTLLVPEGQGAPGGLPFRVEQYASGRVPGRGLVWAVRDGRSLQSGLFDSAPLLHSVRTLLEGTDLAFLQTTRLAALTPYLEGQPFVLDFIDSLSLNFEQRARFDTQALRPFLRFEARRLADDERRLIASAKLGLFVAERDRDHLAIALSENVRTRLAVVPLYVDARRRPGVPRVSGGEFRILISGNLGYFPTLQGTSWFLSEVWPRVKARLPRARLRIAGSRPSGSLRRRSRLDGVDLVVDPIDLAAELAAVDVAAVPLHAGSGVPIKLLEAVAAGVPAVATSWAAEGLESELRSRVMRADSVEAWVEALAAIHDAPDVARDRAADLAAIAAMVHSEERVAEKLSLALSRLGALTPEVAPTSLDS